MQMLWLIVTVIYLWSRPNDLGQFKILHNWADAIHSDTGMCSMRFTLKTFCHLYTQSSYFALSNSGFELPQFAKLKKWTSRTDSGFELFNAVCFQLKKKRNGELKQICYTLMSQCDWNCMNVAFHRFKGSEAWLWLCRPLAAMDGYFKPTNIQYHGVSWPIRSWSDDIMSGCVPYIMHCINTSSRAQ